MFLHGTDINSKANSRLGYQPSLSHLAGPKYLVYTTPEAANSAIRATRAATAPRQTRLTVTLQDLVLEAFAVDVRYHFGCFPRERRDKSVESMEALAVLFSDADRRSSEDLRLFMFAGVRLLLFQRADRAGNKKIAAGKHFC